MNRWLVILAALACLAADRSDAAAQMDKRVVWSPVNPSRVVSGQARENTPPILEAVRVTDADIEIDGRVIEAAWSQAPVAADFIQFEPAEGEPASERTEARVLYGTDALYIAIRAYDSEPEQIVGQLTRRDQDSYSDVVGVVIDSYFDRRTAFQFAVNPVGVKHDIYRFDDTEEDSGWDAVWKVETARDAEGWVAEFRIPYSQLRFRDAREQTWGINFFREIARRDETALWAPITRSDAAVVSKSGELRGLTDLSSPSRMEILPYTVARVERAPGDIDNPFYSKNQTFGTVGADLKYGITGDLTLDVTINPDFGQVEADPAQVNLSAFESFYPERRPFFLEGSSIFNFGIALGDGDNANESLFYSRRIGRAPQGSVEDDSGYSSIDPQTTILGAWKLSGKTAGGWSIGAMHAVTAEESARIAPAGGGRTEQVVEPFTNYGVFRLQRDFRDGRTAVGLISTSANRDKEAADRLGLNSGAYAGGFDVRHRFGGDKYQISGYLLASHVRGSEEAITELQRAPTRYYQRPDAGHIEVDPTRTSLTGASGFFVVEKMGGEHWRFSTGAHTRTPGFEVNDIGFQRDADSFTNWQWAGYQQSTPQGPFRRWNVNFNGWNSWNYDGDRSSLGGNVNGGFQLKNFWGGHMGIGYEAGGYSGRTLRGGPLFKQEPGINVWGNIRSDSRKAMAGGLNVFGSRRGQSDSWELGVSPNLRFRPSGRATFSVGTFINRNVDDYQWIDQFGPDDDATYLFGRIDQTTVGITTRADIAFTPTLSLQLYAQPFVSAGEYSDYKRVADPVADRYEDRFFTLSSRTEDGIVYADVDGDGSEDSFDRPDFNFRQFRSNAVLRWEYVPGSALFLVWSQGRNQYIEDGAFNFRRNVRGLFSETPQNVFLIKVSYWMSR